MQLSSGHRRIGSTFEAESLVGPPEPQSWWAGQGYTLLQSGGQALRAISDQLWREGFRSLILPGFLCESMITPFRGHPWEISYFEFGPLARPALESFCSLAGQSELAVALVAEYFGRALDDDWRSAIEYFRGRGVRVIEDRTHNIFDRIESPADYVVASLRKLLPVGDGGLVLGVGTDVAEMGGIDVGPGVDYWRAMDEKSTAANETQLARANDLFRQSEKQFSLELLPRAATNRTREAIARLDFDLLAARRAENGAILCKLLVNHEVLNRDWSVAPSHVVIRVKKPKLIQAHLAQRGIFCPIHWPHPGEVPSGLGWPNDVISLPIDHRYGREDMEYIAASVQEVGTSLD